MRRTPILFLLGPVILSAVIAFEIGLGVGYGRWGRQVAQTSDGDVAELWRAQADLSADVQAYDLRDATEARLGVHVVRPETRFVDATPAGVFAGRPAGRTPFLRLLPILLTESDRYPPAVVKRFRLLRIVICDDLTVDGAPVGGVSDFATGTLYLAAVDAAAGPAMFRHLIHHELFHLIDHAAGSLGDPDPAWAVGNPPGFHHAGSGFDALPQNASTELSSATAGFVTTYARTAVEEDKAELFGWLMSDPAAVVQLARGDPGVAHKAARLKAVVTALDANLGGLLPDVSSGG